MPVLRVNLLVNHSGEQSTMYFKIRKSISSFKGNLPNSALQAIFVALPLTPK